MAEEKQTDEDYGYNLFPQRDRRNPRKESIMSTLCLLKYTCKNRLKVAMQQNPQVKILLDAMKQAGCTASIDRHFACEDCDNNVAGGFDSATSEVVLCQNTIGSQSQMNKVVTHELIHAYDHCRAHADFLNNIQHLACSEIRAASLSGDCSLTNEMLRLKFGVKEHHQACVREHAVQSILAGRKISRETAEKAVEEVFDTCFNDRAPFGRIPYNKASANLSYREYMNRGRYYANI
ncbi:mitochondrial inner membrane protease ATP23 homolog isoform X1 [Rana temporaria]|uniref:mitochondrial inner membrane protease ATP23 homolog isoform X1 n=2 Tax=Rana temporaria TaxID=8407 RepID=UPI001AAC55DA|nr:mitochondrial inner membrane protease ATP23 homolog isoform X1 [Rana temporaria]